MTGAETQTRTADLLFTKQLLYRLSYPGAREIIGLGVHGTRLTIAATCGQAVDFARISVDSRRHCETKSNNPTSRHHQPHRRGSSTLHTRLSRL